MNKHVIKNPDSPMQYERSNGKSGFVSTGYALQQRGAKNTGTIAQLGF
jgi:hypothetical protein